MITKDILKDLCEKELQVWAPCLDENGVIFREVHPYKAKKGKYCLSFVADDPYCSHSIISNDLDFFVNIFNTLEPNLDKWYIIDEDERDKNNPEHRAIITNLTNYLKMPSKPTYAEIKYLLGNKVFEIDKKQECSSVPNCSTTGYTC